MRKSKSTPADNFFAAVVEATSAIPWWATLPIAFILFYFVPAISTNLQTLSSAEMSNQVLMIFVISFFKYLLPVALVFGGVINVYNILKSKFLFSDIKNNGATATIQHLSWQDFEFLLSEWFKKQGYTTELTGGGGADGGIDIKLYKDAGLYLVQCKHYKVWKVPVQVVRELFGVMTASGAVGGFVVTSGRFTKEAEAFAKGKNIQLLNGKALTEGLDLKAVIPLTDKPVICPKCGSELVERAGKYGKFTGCSAYPKCKFTIATK